MHLLHNAITVCMHVEATKDKERRDSNIARHLLCLSSWC